MNVLLILASLLTLSLASSELKRLVTMLRDLDKIVPWCEERKGQWECNGGRCGGGENHNKWDKGNYFCYRCPGKTGGQQCEISDPCGSNPCPSNKKCKQNSLTVEGYWCLDPSSWWKRSELLDNLEMNADREEYRAIRELVLKTGDLKSAVLEHTKRMLEEDDL